MFGNDNYKVVKESGDLTLYENLTTGEFIIKDSNNQVRARADYRGRAINLLQNLLRFDPFESAMFNMNR